MFSEELYELDRNTIKLMIEEQQEKLDMLNGELAAKRKEVENKDEMLKNSRAELESQKEALSEKDQMIEMLKEKLANLGEKI